MCIVSRRKCLLSFWFTFFSPIPLQMQNHLTCFWCISFCFSLSTSNTYSLIPAFLCLLFLSFGFYWSQNAIFTFNQECSLAVTSERKKPSENIDLLVHCKCDVVHFPQKCILSRVISKFNCTTQNRYNWQWERYGNN